MDINLNGNTLTNGYFAGIVVGSTPSTSTSWTVQSTTYTASTGDRIQVDTSGGVVTITLPATASIGDCILVQDAKLTWNLHNVYIATNGLKINGTTLNYVGGVVGDKLKAVYISTSYGWSIK